MFIRTEAQLHQAVDALIAQCEDMAYIYEICGYPPLRLREGGFAGIMDIVIAQQLSVASAKAITIRVQNLAQNDMDATQFQALSDEKLNEAGLSRPKINTLRAVQEAVLNGVLDFDALYDLSEEEAMQKLTNIKGIGPWSAQIYLSFCMGYRDQFPAGDLALQIATQTLLKLPERPDTKALSEIALRWKPYRSMAAFLLWSYYRKEIKTASGMPI